MIRKLVLLTGLIVVVIGMLCVAFNVQRAKAGGTIYIKADGTIDQPTPPFIVGDGTTYNFTGDIDGYDVVVQRSQITINGKGHKLTGSGVGPGFSLTGITYVKISHTVIQNFTYGVFLDYSQRNRISWNIIQNNSVGVYLYGALSKDNIVSENFIIDNGVGVEVDMDSEFNTLFHNAFVDNGIHARIWGEGFNSWDIWPLGGNRWGNYTGEDWYGGFGQNLTGRDGLGDTPHAINENNIDRYPLMGRFWRLCWRAGILEYCIGVISNSEEVWGFRWHSIEFNVTGPDGTDGFCRVTIPHDLLEPPYTVTVNNDPVTHTTIFENETLSIIYFAYTHSTKEVIIVPEFPSFIIPSLFMIATLTAVIIFKRKHVKNGK